MGNKNRISGKDLKRSLSLVTLAASFGMPFFIITTGPALTGFTRELGAGDFFYSVIMALPVIGAMIQVLASYMIEAAGRRKPFMIVSGLIHRILWIPVAAVPFVILPEHNNARIWAAAIIITLASMANSVNNISFNSWMGLLVPPDIKGRFFSKRTMIYTITGGLSALVCGKLLDIYPGFTGFSAVFVLAAVLGTTDIVLFFWIKEPKQERTEKLPAFHKLFTEPFKNKNYMRFTLFVAFWYFGVNFSGPFFNVYMIEELRMSFLTITLFAQVASSLTTVLFIRFWGGLVDKYGSRPVMWLCCTVIIVLPFVWTLATPGSTWIVLIINMLSGIFWSGFEMTALNQSIWLAPEKNRSIYIASYALVVNIIGTALAFLGGGAFMELTGNLVNSMHLPFLHGQQLSSYHLLFIVSGIVRLLVIVVIFRQYDEIGSKKAGDIISGLYSQAKGKISS